MTYSYSLQSQSLARDVSVKEINNSRVGRCPHKSPCRLSKIGDLPQCFTVDRNCLS